MKNHKELKQCFCKHCKQEIKPGAKKCHHCGSSQTPWHFLSHAPLAISMVMMGIALFQLSEASRERIDASTALDKAEKAENFAREVEVLAENAQKKVIEIEAVTKKVNTTFKELDSNISKKFTQLEDNIANFTNKYDEQLKLLTKEVSYIKNRNEVLRLSDSAIATGNALSFDKLKNTYVSSAEEDIKMIALSEMHRVKNYFATMTGIKAVELTSTINATGKILKNNEIPTEVLIEYLKTSNNWKIRAKAAKLLKNRKEKQVPEALLYAIKKDAHLEVKKLSMDSFERVTGFTSNDVFKYEPALNWWGKKAIDINKTLNQLQTLEAVTGEDLQ